MARSVAGPFTGCQSTPTDRSAVERSTDVDQYFALLRRCVEDCGWTLEALASAMGLDKGYLWKLLNNDKPWRAEYLVALPNDIEALFAQRQAERFGLIVVSPPRGDDAVKHFVGGLYALLTGQIPMRMAKADLPAAAPQRKVG